MNKTNLSKKIRELIVTKNGTIEENEYLTKQIARCSEGHLEAKEYIKNLIRIYLKDEGIQDENLVDEIFSENWGLGILEKYDTSDVDEIIVLGKEILLKKNGQKIRVKETFNNYDEIKAIMRRCLEFNKIKDLNEANAVVSSVRADGSRVQIVIPPVSEYPILNIRKFGFIPTTENMLNDGTFTQKHVDILKTCVKGRANILIIGDTETGKSTVIKWLVGFIEEDKIIATIESEFELYLKKMFPNKLIIPMQERDNYNINFLFPVTLRQSVDIIVLSEIRRSYEALELSKSMTRGHSGSISSFHDLSADGAINSLASLTLESGMNINFDSLKFMFAKSIDLVIKMRKLPMDEEHKEKKICEGIYEIKENVDNLTFQEIPIMQLKIDEENPANSHEQIYCNSISEKLKGKLNYYGVKKSEINEIFKVGD